MLFVVLFLWCCLVWLNECLYLRKSTVLMYLGKVQMVVFGMENNKKFRTKSPEASWKGRELRVNAK